MAEAGWLSGFTKRRLGSADPTKISADVPGFPAHMRIAADAGYSNTDLTQIFTDLQYPPNGEHMIAVTLADGITQVPVEIAMWDWVNKKAHLWVGPATLDATEGLGLYLYWNNGHPGNGDNVSDQWSGDPSAPWDDGAHLLVNHMVDGAAVIEIEDELDTTEIPDYGLWQGVATDEEFWYAITSESGINGIRKYRISDKVLVASNLTAYDRGSYAFSTGAVIDGKLLIAIRDEGGEDDARIVEYQLEASAAGAALSQIVGGDHDIAFNTYEYPESVTKHSLDGVNFYYWVMFGGNGNANTGTYPNGRKCAVIRYDLDWTNPIAYDLYTVDAGNKFGGQDIKFISPTDFLTTPHGTVGANAEHPRGFLERWHWNGAGFEFATKFATPADGGSGNKLGQGFVRLRGDDDTWYFAARDQAGSGVDSRLVKCTFLPYADSLLCPDFSTNSDEPDAASVDEASSPTQQADDSVGYRQYFGGDDGNEMHLRCGQGSNLEITGEVTLEAYFIADDFLEGADERNTIIYLKGGVYLQVRGVPNDGKIAVYLRSTTGDGPGYLFSTTTLVAGTDYVVMLTFDAATDTARLYVDGVAEGGSWPYTSVLGDLTYIGAGSYNSIGAEVSDPGGGTQNWRFLEGKVMEVRVTDDVKSAAWALASNHNMRDSLLSWGPLEVLPPSPDHVRIRVSFGSIPQGMVHLAAAALRRAVPAEVE